MGVSSLGALRLVLLLYVLAVCIFARQTAHQAKPHQPIHTSSDAWGPLSAPVAVPAVDLYNEAVRAYAGLRGQVLEPLNEALEQEPSYLMAHVYRGSILLLSTGVLKSHPLVQATQAAVRNYTATHVPNAREQAYLQAFDALYEPPTPDFALAARYWEETLDMLPRDLLAIRACHDAYIILGDTANLRASLARVQSRWDLEEEEGQNDEQDLRMVRAMWAFALEECGDLHRAAEVARTVLEEDPTDVTALHALAHTYEMVSQKADGEDMYKEFEGKWEDLPSLFTNHVAWHRALFELDLEGQQDKALAVFDTVLLQDGGKTPPATPLGMADASSLLWRASLKGVDVGDRWQQLRAFYAAGGYETAHTTSFNDMHLLMCLAHADLPAAYRALASMKQHAAKGRQRGKRLAHWVGIHLPFLPKEKLPLPLPRATNALVLDAVGLQVGEALIKYVEGDYRKTVALLSASMPRWQRIGGSHAQRDILALTLIEACVQNGTDLPLARRLLAERAAVKDPSNEEGVWTTLWAVEDRLQAEAETALPIIHHHQLETAEL